MKIGYRPDIDGLRAISVLAVILFHAGWGMSGGYVGVDVFFVISGFLITSLIVAELDQQSFSLARFWERRIRRIWPASIVVTLTMLAAGGIFMLPLDYKVLAGDAVAQALMLANVRFWRAGDYLGDILEFRPLLHMWSLAVEEQFYLLFPFLLVLTRSWGRAWSSFALAAVAVASFAASVLLLETWRQAVFYLLPFRAWELLVGGLVAMLPVARLPRQGWMRNLLGLLGLALILVPCWSYDRRTPFPAVAAVPPCLGAALLILAGSGVGGALPAVSRIIAMPPLVAIGRMSYSLYLWHWPVLASLRYCFGVKLTEPVTAAALAAVALVSYASWRWVEQPFRRTAEPGGATGAAPRTTPWKTIWIAAAACGAVVALSLLIRRHGGLPWRFTAEHAGFGQAEQYSVAMVHRGTPADDGKWYFPTVGRPTEGRPCFLLWGDSQALAISESIGRRAEELGIDGVAAIMYATVPVPGAWMPRGFSLAANSPAKAKRWSGGVIDWIRNNRPRHVILCAAWSVYVPPTGLHGIAPLNGAGPADTPPGTVLRAGLEAVLEECRRIDATLWVLKEIPYQPWQPRQRAIAAHFSGGPIDVCGIDRATHERRHGAVAAIIDGLPPGRLRILDLAEPFFGEDGVSVVGRGGQAWFYDETHINTLGADGPIGDLLQAMLAEVARDCGG